MTNKSFLNIFIIFFILFSVFFINISNIWASSLWDQQEGIKTIGTDAYGKQVPDDIRVTVVKIIKVFLGFLAVIFLVLIIWAGYLYMTAAGNEEGVTKAKKLIAEAIIGLIIIFMSYSITVYVSRCMIEVMSSGMSWMCKF